MARAPRLRPACARIEVAFPAPRNRGREMRANPAGTDFDYDSIWRDVYGDMQEVGPTHRHLRRLLRELVGEVDYESAFEVGCGAGHNLPTLAEGRPDLKLGG